MGVRFAAIRCLLPQLYPNEYDVAVKPICFLGDSQRRLRAFPAEARLDAGFQLWKVQRGEQPDDCQPMPSIGRGAEEIRVRAANGAFRVVQLARRAQAVYVLHAFAKKTRATAQRDIELARPRWNLGMRKQTETFGSIWDALANRPGEAANLQLRAELMQQVAVKVRSAGWSQAEAARRCGISQPRMNDLLRGRMSRFSLDALVNIATALKRRVKLSIHAA